MREYGDRSSTETVKYFEWRLSSKNRELFVLKDFRYDEMIIVLGGKTNYWMFYENFLMGKSYCGSGELACSFCGCCINKQIVRIVQSITKDSKGLQMNDDYLER